MTAVNSVGNALTGSTGTGKFVGDTSPTLVTPALGVATATSINKVAITAPATSATLTIADGKTLTVSNTLTFTGTDSSSVEFGAGGTVAYSAGTTFTPVLKFGGGTTGITYTTQSGNYKSAGGILHFTINLVLSSKGSSTGSATITGMPVTSTNTGINYFLCSQTGITYASGTIIATLNASATTLNIQNLISSTGETAFTDAAFTNTSVLRISGSYLV